MIVGEIINIDVDDGIKYKNNGISIRNNFS